MKNRKRFVSILAGVMAAVMLLTLIVSLLPTTARAASSSEIRGQINELKEQREEIQKQLEDVKEQYKGNENEIADIVARKNRIDQEIGLLHTEIININAQISAYNVMIADKQDELDHAEDRLEQLEEDYRVRIRTMEEDGSISYWEVLFKANSFSDLLDRVSMVEEIAASDRRRLEELKEAADNVAVAQEELAAEKAEVEATRDELDATQLELDDKRQEADDLLAELVDKGYELADLQKEVEAEKQELMDEIARKEKEYSEAKHQEWLDHIATATTMAPPPTNPSSAGGNDGNGGGNGGSGGGTPSSTGWLLPCHYVKLTSPFGRRESPTAGASTFHQGVDLGAPAGTPIMASRSGVVTTATFGRAPGYYVTINHGDGFSSIYMHMTNYIVSPGQAVSAGQVIGYVGSTGISTGNHLHFGIAYNGAYVNPALYVALY